ncbi:MAG: hypothetical protein COU25_03845 [Candidatus Levybacteria bacterium CG10_big_fil_rev_8_21_14_0_10_35_13]|nr:MAG: hypothetical protein COU25_03845 [Candidatus Levybacteria bacterium CG10_big_fil_rev_8_21_14_0_10_35_13]
MKVLFLTRSFYPNIGGVEKHILELSKVLISKGYKITVLSEINYGNNYHSKSPIGNPKGEISGIKIYRINTGKNDWFKKFRIWKELFKNINLFFSADIVHCHDVFFWYLPFRFIFPFKKIYTTFHGYEGNNIPTKKAIFMHKIAEVLSNGNICVGDYLKKWYGTKPTIVIYGAINIPENLSFQQSVNEIKNVLYIGRLEEEAGILTYLKTLKILKDLGINFKLTVLGDGKQKKQAQKYSSDNNLNVTFKGFVKEVYDYLPKTDIVFTSRYLGTLESFVFKKFVFCVYNNEIKKDCFKMSPFGKFIILEENPNMLAKEVLKYIKNPNLYNTKITKAYSWVKLQTWENLASQYIKLWKQKGLMS